MFLDWLIAQLRPELPGLWLVLSLLTGVAGYAFLHLRPQTAGMRPWLSTLRLLGIPYAGLLVGGLSPRLMGVGEIDWLASAGWGVGLILGLLGFLLLVRPGLVQPDGPSMVETPAYPLLHAGLWEFHWAFLRGGLWAMLLSLGQVVDLSGVAESLATQPAYWAVWTTAAIGLAEIMLAARMIKLTRTAVLVRVFTLLTTSVLFLYTRNFWLCWLLHAGIFLALTQKHTVTSQPSSR